MKRILPILLVLLVFTASCKKVLDDWGCNCKNPYPISQDANVPDISWTEYNSVRDACLHFERIVNLKDLMYGNLPSYVLEHIGDTLKVFGWLWNSEMSLMDNQETWIANDKKYATGFEEYPPWTGVGGGYGEGIELTNLHITDSTHIQSKCFITGIILFTSFYKETGETGNPCEHLRLKLKVTDIFFEEGEK